MKNMTDNSKRQMPASGIAEKKSNSRNKTFRRWFLLACFIVGIPILYVAWKVGAYSVFGPSGFQPTEMVLAQYTPTDVVGDLGGMKVVIPRYYAEYVEYEGDTGFGEKRKESRPVRTFDSRLESFGMDVRFPDMKGLVDWQTRKEKRRQSLHESTWLRVSVSAGKHYYGDGSLNRLAGVVLKPDEYPGDYWWNNYVKLPENKYGLEVYVVAGPDPKTGEPARESHRTKDIYLQRQPTGKVDTHITCERPRVSSGVARCRMKFTLEPKAHVGIEVRLRPALLPEWRKIKVSVRDLLLNFEAKGKPERNASATDTTHSN